MRLQHISDVIIRLNEIIRQTKASQNRMGYFAALYKRMTVAVENGINQHAFEDGERMNRLDVVFAQRYIDAYDAYTTGKHCSASWKCAFDCCKEEGLIVIQHLLLGVNTHINLDLAIAAATVAPGSAIDALQRDFNKINDVIASLIDDVQESLCEVWLPMRLLEKVAAGRHMAVLNFSIDKARTASWASALILAGMNDGQQQFYVQQMDNTVCRLAEAIKKPGFMTAIIVKGIHATEYHDIARTIHLIDTTLVD